MKKQVFGNLLGGEKKDSNITDYATVGDSVKRSQNSNQRLDR